MRPVSFLRRFIRTPAGSCLAAFGDTKVICTCTIEEGTPPFVDRGAWLTAEYAMLPGSVSVGRKRRDGLKKDGRSVEIQRLIGRSLRAAVNLEALPQVTLTIDCDVLQADGGTRTAAISGAWLALYDALTSLAANPSGGIPEEWLAGRITAVSVGIVDGEVICDLDYQADRAAEVDMNIVALDDSYVEIQGTGEKGVFDRGQLNALLDSAVSGLKMIAAAQDAALEG
jgi:ribonuclease PH